MQTCMYQSVHADVCRPLELRLFRTDLSTGRPGNIMNCEPETAWFAHDRAWNVKRACSVAQKECTSPGPLSKIRAGRPCRAAQGPPTLVQAWQIAIVYATDALPCPSHPPPLSSPVSRNSAPAQTHATLQRRADQQRLCDNELQEQCYPLHEACPSNQTSC